MVFVRSSDLCMESLNSRIESASNQHCAAASAAAAAAAAEGSFYNRTTTRHIHIYAISYYYWYNATTRRCTTAASSCLRILDLATYFFCCPMNTNYPLPRHATTPPRTLSFTGLFANSPLRISVKILLKKQIM